MYLIFHQLLMFNPSISQRGLSGSCIQLVSWNARGLRGPIKRSKVFSRLRGLKTDIAFLQETHLRINDHFRMHKPWVGQIFHSAFNSKSRVLLFLLTCIQFLPDQIISDLHGHYVIVSDTLSVSISNSLSLYQHLFTVYFSFFFLHYFSSMLIFTLFWSHAIYLF